MTTTIEGFVPYHQSCLWRIHDAYYRARGTKAFSAAEVPYRTTSNPAIARQHAEWWVATRADDAGEGPLWVLEVGGGSGLFAENFLNALAAECGAAGARLFSRVRYVLTDGSARTLADALARPSLAALARAGRLITAELALESGALPRLPDGEPMPAPALVMASYVACVSRTHWLRRTEGSWSALEAKLKLREWDGLAPPTLESLLSSYLAEGGERSLLERCDVRYRWQTSPLEGLFDDDLHARVLARLAPDGGDLTLAYPVGFVEFVCRLAPALAPGGAILIDDYGRPEVRPSGGPSQPRPTLYGDSLNHGVTFAVFDALAAELGWGLRRTSAAGRPLYQVLLAPDGLPEAAGAAFDQLFDQRQDGNDLLDFVAAARMFAADGKPARALRFWMRALPLDRRSAMIPFEIGRCYHQQGDFDRAREWFRRSLELAPPSVTHAASPEALAQALMSHDQACLS